MFLCINVYLWLFRLAFKLRMSCLRLRLSWFVLVTFKVPHADCSGCVDEPTRIWTVCLSHVLKSLCSPRCPVSCSPDCSIFHPTARRPTLMKAILITVQRTKCSHCTIRTRLTVSHHPNPLSQNVGVIQEACREFMLCRPGSVFRGPRPPGVAKANDFRRHPRVVAI